MDAAFISAAMLFAIGDIHGHFDKLMDLMALCRALAEHRGQSARFVLLGDYVDRGPASSQVLEFLASRPNDVQAIKGNHEDLMWRAQTDLAARDVWMRNGGIETLESYAAFAPDQASTAHLDLIEKLPLFVDDGLRLFVHAGIDPADPDARDPAILMWTRQHPADDAELPRYVVHGHTPTRSRKPDFRNNRLNLDTGAGYGHALTAAGFDDGMAHPLLFLNHQGDLTATGLTSRTGLV